MDRTVSVIALSTWARLLAQAVSIASGHARTVLVPPHERLLGIALGVALLGFATSMVALIVVLVWLCR